MRFFSIIIFTIICTSFINAEESKLLYWSDEAKETAKQYRERIEAELETLPDESWAGVYRYGYGNGPIIHLYISPENGFEYSNGTEMGISSRNYGDVESSKEFIQLSPQLSLKPRSNFHLTDAYHIVNWGERKYLIPEYQMIDFCNSINLKDEPRYHWGGMYFIKDGHEDIEVEGMPDVPLHYKRYLLDEPITAKVIEIKGKKTKHGGNNNRMHTVTVEIDKGSDTKLLPGIEMELTTTKIDCFVRRITITEVKEKTSLAEIIYFNDAERDIEVGWEFSTESPFYVSLRERHRKRKAEDLKSAE